MSKRRCNDCEGTEDVRAHSVEDWPQEWGPYYLCRNCREVLDDIEMGMLSDKERRLLADWGTLGQRRAS